MADSSLPTTSTAASSFLTNGDGRQGDDAKVGMIIVGIVLLFLFCMVVLRYGCNLLIDIFVLRDGDSLVRTISELRRLLCPCWHPRTEPTAVGVGAGGAGDAGGSGNNDGGTDESVSMETLLTGLTQKQKQELLASVVPSKTATNQDIKQWKQQSGILSDACHSDSSNEFGKKSSSRNRSKSKKSASKISRQDGDGSGGGGGGHGSDEYCSGSENDSMKRTRSTRQSTTQKSHEYSDSDVEQQQPQQQQQQQHHCHTTLICPICIHDIEKGHQVCYSGFCHHLFHRDCLSAWLSTHARICPYCRGEIMTQEMLNEAYRRKLAQQETVGWDEADDDDNDDDDDDHDSGDDDDDESSVDSFSRYRP